MRDSVPSTRYSSVCNVLRQWQSRSSLLIESTDSMIYSSILLYIIIYYSIFFYIIIYSSILLYIIIYSSILLYIIIYYYILLYIILYCCILLYIAVYYLYFCILYYIGVLSSYHQCCISLTYSCGRSQRNFNYYFLLNHSKLSPSIYMTIYKSTNLQSVNIKTLKSSNRSNKIMFVYLLNND